MVTGFYSLDFAHKHGFSYDIGTAAYTLAQDPVVPNLFLVQFLGINDHNVAAGYWQDNTGSQHGLLYDLTTHQYTFMDDPNRAAFNNQTFTQITGINDDGRIAGFFVDGNGIQHGFFAEPATAAPGTCAFGLMGFGIVGIAVIRLRRRRPCGHR